ncbi:alpha/beta hydrolase [Pseudomonas sp. 5Ae-yellow]|uniref:alpha/beta hydrolase n=1 Tax=Pseudomonas sp. 5Ae-yellow TaxID=2759848 RepID=UPI0015F5357D|nr:alpha/beta hydrolase [Pseudomonas sp. 5Ae-yellow]MBA6420707.1 alpha/beta hydrolase [Pseudomonas sp. 5Ae-yellow]|tara:strand:- start:4350 stop:5327 length:978 start_codon:yes stop_codon:yes gene_type:complete
MTAYVDQEFTPEEQPRLRAFLRAVLRLFFRGLIRPPVPLAMQRLVLSALTCIMPLARGVSRRRGLIAERPCEWHRPAEGSDGRVMLYLHGGAFILGSPATHRSLCSALLSRGKWDLCALDYRLAPTYPNPAARDDCVAAYQALLTRGYRPEHITIAGDSAGGNLVLVTAQRLQQLGLPMPESLVCFSPVTDFTGEQVHTPAAGDPLIHPAWMDLARDAYCQPGQDRADPAVSPLYGKLRGLPRLLLQVGEDELLLNDSLRLAEAARAEGVQVRLERYKGLWHVFQAHTGLLTASDQALDRVVDFVRVDKASTNKPIAATAPIERD